MKRKMKMETGMKLRVILGMELKLKVSFPLVWTMEMKIEEKAEMDMKNENE